MYYKFFREDGRTTFGREPWPVMEWMPDIEGELLPCYNGYHVCREIDLVNWIGPKVALVMIEGDTVVSDFPSFESKVVARKAMNMGFISNWNTKTMVRFGLDCADHILEPGMDDYWRVLHKARRIFERDLDVKDPRLMTPYYYGGNMKVYQTVQSAIDIVKNLYPTNSVSNVMFYAQGAKGINSEALKAEREWQTKRLLQYFNGEVR